MAIDAHTGGNFCDHVRSGKLAENVNFRKTLKKISKKLKKVLLDLIIIYYCLFNSFGHF